MSKKTDSKSARIATTTVEEVHLICSSGGSRAILGGAGAIMAFDHAGMKDFTSIGGVSGGSIPTVMYAAGISARDTFLRAIDCDFSSMLTKRANIFSILMAYYRKGRLARTRPRQGVMTSELLGEYIDNMVDEWPKGYWTMAVVGENRILFNETGVYEVMPDGSRITLSSKPAPLGVAVRASCAVPGIISAMPYKGRYLFDGALSEHGRCPIVVPIEDHGAHPQHIIAVDAGEDTTKSSQRLTRLWGILAGTNCVPFKHERVLTDKDVKLLVKPDLSFFKSLQFSLTPDQKWRAAMAGYVATVDSLKNAGMIAGKTLESMLDVVSAFKRIESACQFFTAEGVLAEQTQQLLCEAGLI